MFWAPGGGGGGGGIWGSSAASRELERERRAMSLSKIRGKVSICRKTASILCVCRCVDVWGGLCAKANVR